MRALAIVGVVMVLLSAQSCSRNTPEAQLDNYVARLGRALSTAPPPAGPVSMSWRPRPPAPQPSADRAIGLIGFVKLKPCRLQQIIAQRNSSLGKLAQPSQRLLNTIAYLRWVEPCLARLDREQDAELIGELQAAATTKRQVLPTLLWRAMLGSAEAQSFWQRHAPPYDYPHSVNGGETINALEQLTQLASAWLRQDYQQPSGAQLETFLQHLSLGDGGQLLTAAALLQAQLQRADQLIEQRVAAGAICKHGQASTTGNILANVVSLFLIGEIQPWSAGLNRRYYDLWPALQRLEDVLATGEPTPYRQWRQQRDANLRSQLSSPRRHAERLQPLLASCGLAPTRSG